VVALGITLIISLSTNDFPVPAPPVKKKLAPFKANATACCCSVDSFVSVRWSSSQQSAEFSDENSRNVSVHGLLRGFDLVANESC
jgi:hypothetical protein